MSNRKYIYRKKQATSAPPPAKDAVCWAPGIHITCHVPLDLQVVHNIMAHYPWTVCTAVEEPGVGDVRHTHIMIWAPHVPLGPTEVRWSAKELSGYLGKWPYIVPVLTQNQAVTVTAYQCKRSMPALYACNQQVQAMWQQAVYDKSEYLQSEAAKCQPHLVDSYNQQVRRIRDAWNIYPEQ